jgi:tetratricopeptide (TPR) repeat protein
MSRRKPFGIHPHRVFSPGALLAGASIGVAAGSITWQLWNPLGIAVGLLAFLYVWLGNAYLKVKAEVRHVNTVLADTRAELSSEVVDLESIRRLAAALEFALRTVSGDERTSMRLARSALLIRGHTASHESGWLKTAVGELEALLPETQPTADLHTFNLYLLAIGLALQFEMDNSLQSFEHLDRISRQALSRLAEGDEQWVDLRTNNANALRIRYTVTHQPGDLADALDEINRTLNISRRSQADANMTKAMITKAHILGLLYESTWDQSTLDDGVATAREVVEALEDGSERASALSQLAELLLARFEARDQPLDRAQAEQACRDGLKQSATDSSTHRWLVTNLSMALRFKAVDGSEAATEEAVQYARQALSMGGDEDRGWLEFQVAATLRVRYFQTGTQKDLDEMVDLLNDALRYYPEDSIESSQIYAFLSGAYHLRWFWNKTREELDRAVAAAAVALNSRYLRPTAELA